MTQIRGSIPELYETHLVPLIFQHYAEDLTSRLLPRSPGRVLEVAAGTGAVTRLLAQALPGGSSIVATDVGAPMLDQARAIGTHRPVEWRQADAMHLPFDDGAFDAVVCQFGVMFFADRSRAFGEARRVLRPGGILLFNVWDRIEQNEFADTVSTAVAALFPENPPRYLAQRPYGYFDGQTIERDLRNGGFAAAPHVATVPARSRAASSEVPAIGYCRGTPLRTEIEARDPSRLDEAIGAAAKAIADRFGKGPVEGKIQAHVLAIER
jgi:SAM-dependent methyltransferase